MEIAKQPPLPVSIDGKPRSYGYNFTDRRTLHVQTRSKGMLPGKKKTIGVWPRRGCRHTASHRWSFFDRREVRGQVADQLYADGTPTDRRI